MKLNAEQLLELSQLAIFAAREAGQIISQHSHHQLVVKTKPGANSLAAQVLTEVDILCENIILKILQASCETFDLALLSEETPDDLTRLEKDYFWCIDPLDGTLAFIEEIPGYAVAIALVSRQGIAQIGVIYNPVEQCLYHAVIDQGVFRNNLPWTIAAIPAPTQQSLTLIADRSFKQHRLFTPTLTELERLAKNLGYSGLNTILYGGAAMNACWVLEKAPACYFKYPKPEEGGGCLWDYTATTCLFNQAGAIASNIYGNPLDLNRIDSIFMNHHGVLFASDNNIALAVKTLLVKLHNH